VKGSSIQIHDSHPTSIFQVEVTKRVQSFPPVKILPGSNQVEESWTIKVSIGQIIELANKLNIKYSASERSLPNLEVSLMDF
jgi:hypothetical protein